MNQKQRDEFVRLLGEGDLAPSDIIMAVDRLRARVAELEEPQVGSVRCPHCDEEHDVQLSRGRTNDPNRTDQSGEGGS